MSASTPGPTEPPLPPSVVAAERRTREYLARAEWRKARDEIKPVVRMANGRFLPLLVEANVGLAREMLGKGQVGAAKQVLSYLSTVAPPEMLRWVEFELNMPPAGSVGRVAWLAGALADPALNLPDDIRVRLADQLVLDSEEVAADGGVAVIGAEVRAVREALREVSAGGDAGRVRDLLRPLSHRSPLRHWVSLVRGLAEFHGGELDRAARWLDGLPPGSAPARASQPYRLWLEASEGAESRRPARDESALEGLSQLLGMPGVGGVLARADRLWKSGSHVDSYRLLRDRLEGFPSEGLDWLGALSEFYFHSPLTLSEEKRDEFLGYFEDLKKGSGFKNRVEELLTLRMLALVDGPGDTAWSLTRNWLGYLERHRELHGDNPRLASLAHTWLGGQLAQTHPSPFFFARGEAMRDAHGAVGNLTRAIKLDPQNLAAHLRLAEVHRALGNPSERNRLLDEMTRRFPDEKAVLVEAATGCLEREAYTKSLKYLERARQLDRLDPRIPELIVTASLRLARQYYVKQQPERGRDVWSGLGALLADRGEDLLRSRWTVRLREGLLEGFFGDRLAGDAALADARARSPFPAAFLWLAHLAYRAEHRIAGQMTPFLEDLKVELKREPSAAHGILLVRILDQVKEGVGGTGLNREIELLRGYLHAAARRPCTRAEARQLVELAGRGGFASAARAFIKAMLHADPADPLFRLCRHLLEVEGRESGLRRTAPGDHAELEGILQEAVRRRDDETAQRVRNLLRIRRHGDGPGPLPHGPWDPFEDENEEDESEFEEAIDGPRRPPGFPMPAMPDMSPRERKEYETLLELIAHASDAEIHELRRNRPAGMPGAVFDAFLDAIRGDSGRTPPRASRPEPGGDRGRAGGGSSPARSGGDSYQPELF